MLIHTLSIFAQKEFWQAHFLKLWQCFPHRSIFSWILTEISWCWMVHFYLPYYFRQSYDLCAILLGVLGKNTKKLQKFLHIWKWIGKQVTISDTFRQSPLSLLSGYLDLCVLEVFREEKAVEDLHFIRKRCMVPQQNLLFWGFEKNGGNAHC